MWPQLGGWIHSFTVTDTSKHKQGYTIYKITSIVFPRSVPQALTCVTVWKRFHDIKRLHRDLCRRQKILQLNVHIPEPNDCIFFRRFDVAIIENRKKYILELLDVVAQHQDLYKSQAFIEFFSGGHSPSTTTQYCEGDINNGNSFMEICAGNDLGHNKLFYNILGSNSDVKDNENYEDDCGPIAVTGSTPKIAAAENNINHEALAPDNRKKVDDISRFLTPLASTDFSSNGSDYIYEAALEFSRAVQAEANLNYMDAYRKYLMGVDVLRNGCKGDDNDERKFIAETKISKYLTRADDIVNKFLKKNSEISSSHFQLTVDLTGSALPSVRSPHEELPWNHLSKYKVQRILGDRVMQVQCTTEPLQATYIMRSIEKPPNSSLARTVFLPQNIPYMVDLVAFFQSEEKIFLLLRQAEGGRLYDYVSSYKPLSARYSNLNQIFPEVEDAEAGSDASNLSAQDSGFVDNCRPPQLTNNNQHTLRTETTSRTEISELVTSSQQLLKSVSNTLKSSECKHLPEGIYENAKVVNVDSEHIEEHPCLYSGQVIALPEVCLKQWASELAVAIHALHCKGIILGDLHMDNLLLGAKGQLLLTYFYQNEALDADTYVCRSFSAKALAGHYVAPEGPMTTKSDWWSYGVILYHLLLGLPFKEAHPGRIDIYGCVQYPEEANISDNARDLLDNLLTVMPDLRLGYKEIQTHRFFKEINWIEVVKKGTTAG